MLGGIALTLFGVQQVRDSVTKALGSQLRLLLEKSTRQRWKAFGSGILVTSLIQSATATILIITSLATQRLIPVAPALAVSLGADVGTTLVAQIFSLDVSWLGPVFILIGMVMFSWFPYGRMRHWGMMCIGLGLILIGLGTVINAAHMVEETQFLRVLFDSVGEDVMMAFLIGILMTWAAQSSLSIVLLVMSFAAAGILDIDTAFVFVLGSHVGSSITPMLVNMRHKNEALLIALGGFFMRLASCIAVLPFVSMIAHDPLWGNLDVSRKIVDFHTGFSLLRAFIFLPLLGPISALLHKAFPFKQDMNDPSRLQYLDERDLASPSVALASATREALRLGDLVLSMLRDVKDMFQVNNPGRLQLLHERDNDVDRLYEQIKFYLAKLSRESMDDAQARRHIDVLTFITNLEYIGDIVDKNLCELAHKKWRDNLTFSKQGWEEIDLYHQRICNNFHLAMNVFNSNDPVLARQLVRQKEQIYADTMSTTGSHFERLRQGLLESMRSSSLHLDIIRDLRRVNDYLTSVAYNILEKSGDLQSRLRDQQQ